MNIDISLLKGEHVYLEFLLTEHIEALRALAKDDRIWEFTKTLLVNDQYNQRFDDYIMLALDRNALALPVAMWAKG